MAKLKTYEVTREQTVRVSAENPEDAAKIAVAGFNGDYKVDGVEGGTYDKTVETTNLTVRRDII